MHSLMYARHLSQWELHEREYPEGGTPCAVFLVLTKAGWSYRACCVLCTLGRSVHVECMWVVMRFGPVIYQCQKSIVSWSMGSWTLYACACMNEGNQDADLRRYSSPEACAPVCTCRTVPLLPPMSSSGCTLVRLGT